ncbi:hypothetical protein ACIA8K_23090 [Catenuloplanes sp. NPDC051500]|uniref:hypothetical protein n=1 Tax=Catenuloplanes sp. NPDC051500 TaxID=3363959 RepID=UPI0037A00399
MQLEEFVMTRLDQESGPVSRDDLDNLWRRLFPDSFTTRRGRTGFLQSIEATADSTTAGGTDLEFKAGGWEIDLSRAATQTMVATAFLGGLLTVLGAAQLPAAVATAVIPLLFDVRRVTLKASEQEILADLVGSPDLDGGMTPADLYAMLSPTIRDQLSRLEFADFLDTCRRAGVLDQAPDGTVRVRPAEQARFRISLR